MLTRNYPLALLFGFLVLLVGCDNFENPVSSPEVAALEEDAVQALNFVKLPKPDGIFKPSENTEVSATISPRTGGRLALDYSDGSVRIQASLHFAPGSVNENVDVTMELVYDSDALEFKFSKSGTTFLKPGRFSVNARGLDLEGVEDLKLVYYNNDTEDWEEAEEIDPQMLRYNVKTGQLQCINAPINHFSRYAFAF